jgi:hypothetical protein
MNKKTYGIVGLVVVVIAVAVFALVQDHGNGAAAAWPAEGERLSRIRREAPAHPAACAAQANAAGLNISKQTRNSIEMAVIGSIVDVPAGTNVDVYAKSFDGTTVTGTSKYEGSYGTYNFTVKKTTDVYAGSSQTNWRVTAFQPCKW